MIKIDRSGVAAPPCLTEETGAGPRETRRNKEYAKHLDKKVKDPASSPSNTFQFGAYRRREVKEALVAISHGKCSYCEKRFAATQPVDVEHWRPKGQVVLASGEKILGYYWLAADWDNLLPSCIDCNRARVQKSPLGGPPETLGKQDQFPIWREKDRWTDPDSSNTESPLLLHPYFDDPDDALEFTPEGVAKPRSGSGEPDSGPTHRERAEASIRVYALNRVELVNERSALLRRIERIKLTIVLLMQLLTELGKMKEKEEAERLQEIVKQVLDQEFEALAQFLNPESEFAGMARQRIEKFLTMIRPDG